MTSRASFRRLDQPWVLIVAVVALLAASTAITYMAGGTKTPLPHAFYIPVVVAAGAFGVRSGLLAGMTAGILCGPLMPLNVEENLAQPTVGWLIRLGFFLLIALVVGYGRRRLLELSRARQRFLSVVSHELRTPLASVVGFAELLANRDLDYGELERREFIDLILKEATEMANVVDHYVVEGRLRDAALFIDPHPTDLRKIVDIVLDGLPAELRKTRVEVHGSHIVCVADPLRLRQILRSIFNNALAYTDDRVLVDLTVDRAQARVRVSEQTGKPSSRSRLPKPSWTTGGHEEASPPPLGLGLAVSRELAQRMGGDLTYEVNGSTSFDLRLPLGRESRLRTYRRPRANARDRRRRRRISAAAGSSPRERA